MSKLFRIIVGLLLLVIIPLIPFPVNAVSKKQVVLILADCLNLNDLAAPEAAFLQELINKGTFGLMNINTASTRTSPNTHASISAGRPAFGGNGLIIAAEANEIINSEAARITFKRYTGSNLRDGEVCVLNWPQIIEANTGNNNAAISLGLIGEALKRVGLKTGVLGNSDLPEKVNRPAAIITADLDGITSFGLVGSELLSPSGDFLPWVTNYEKLVEITLDTLKFTNFLVIDTGDLSRLDNYGNRGLKEVVTKERKELIANLNEYTSRLFKEIDPTNTLFILASSVPPSSKLTEKNYLVPIILIAEYIRPGLVYSNTTRREGLITSADLTTTILDFLNADVSNLKSKLIGQPISGTMQNTDNNLERILQLNQRLNFIYQMRPLLVKPYIILQIITILFSILLFFIFKKLIPLFLSWLDFLVAFPAALLVAGAFQTENYCLYIFLSLILSFMFLIFSKLISRATSYKSFTILGLMTSLLIIADLLMGSILMKQSVLGYDPIIGARYYGIGNEYMGVLIGSSLLGLGPMVDQNNKRIYLSIGILYFVFMIWLIFSPSYGTNFGGTIAAIAAFLYWAWRWIKDLFKNPKAILGILFLLITLICISSLIFGSKQSHIGKAFSLLFQEGNKEIYEIILRKIEMNLKLIRYTNWGKIFLLALLTMFILFFKPRGFIQLLYQKHRSLYESLTAILVGSIAALLFNDSGIVAASTAMIYAVYPLLNLALV